MNNLIEFNPTNLESIITNHIPVRNLILNYLSIKDLSKLSCVNNNFNILASDILKNDSDNGIVGFINMVNAYMAKVSKEDQIKIFCDLNLDPLNPSNYP